MLTRPSTSNAALDKPVIEMNASLLIDHSDPNTSSQPVSDRYRELSAHIPDPQEGVVPAAHTTSKSSTVKSAPKKTSLGARKVAVTFDELETHSQAAETSSINLIDVSNVQEPTGVVSNPMLVPDRSLSQPQDVVSSAVRSDSSSNVKKQPVSTSPHAGKAEVTIDADRLGFGLNQMALDSQKFCLRSDGKSQPRATKHLPNTSEAHPYDLNQFY